MNAGQSSTSLLPHGSQSSSRQPSYDGTVRASTLSQRRPAVDPTPTEAGMRVHLVRAIALLCACSLSIGSHYASYILGPLKTRLSREMGTSNTEFSLLLAAFSLNSTWTPLVGGILAGRLGTTVTSIIATGVIFVGQATLLLGDALESVRLMTLGMFIFGLGVSPLAVVQESIIVRFFKNHGLGLSMALGLVVGKASSFIAARTSYPLSEAFGPRAPFIAASSLSALSFIVNLVYLSASKWLVNSTGTELEASELHSEADKYAIESVSEAQALKQVAKKRTVHMRDITKLGDVFWAYIGLNVFCGAIWSPFTHLAANMIEKRYELTEEKAGRYASYLLAGSIFLYPLVGFIIDRVKSRSFLHQLFILSSTLTGLCYLWLVLPPRSTQTPLPAIAFYGIGQGYAPLLLVILVPTLVSTKYVSTTLGAHKSLEQCGTTIFQTFAGLFLDKVKNETSHTSDATASEQSAIQQLLNVFFFLNICHFLAILGLWALDNKRKAQFAETESKLHEEGLLDHYDDEVEEEIEPISPASRTHGTRKERASESHSLRRRESRSPANRFTIPLPSETQARDDIIQEGGEADEAVEEDQPLLRDERSVEEQAAAQVEMPTIGEAQTRAEHVRGEVFGVMSICTIAFAWVFFITTAFLRLRAKKDRS